MSSSVDQASRLQYLECYWGDAITGTKAQLQSLGVGVLVAFPGEPGARARVVNTLDPRGFRAKITKSHGDGCFHASIAFPGREVPPYRGERQLVFPGVYKTEEFWTDDYCGTAEALVGFGVVAVRQLPGQPGMRKVRSRVFVDGSSPSGPPTTSHKQSGEPGAKVITRASQNRYVVSVKVEEAMGRRRMELHTLRRDEWATRMSALPRPPQLSMINPVEATEVLRGKGHLRLVWSAPNA